MEALSRITSVRTVHLVWTAFWIFIAGALLDPLGDSLWGCSLIYNNQHTVFETLSSVIAAVGYGSLWILLPVAAFRPEREFTRNGDGPVRAVRLVIVLLLLVHLLGGALYFLVLSWRLRDFSFSV